MSAALILRWPRHCTERMPPRRKKKKGKNQSSHRTEAAVSCAFCARPVSRNDDGVIECICTRVLFCSESCQEQALSSKTHDCLGPPEATIDMSQRLREIQGSDVFRNNSEKRRQFDEEYRRTVTQPITAFLLSQRGVQYRDLTVNEYASYADQGNVPFAYLAGIQYKNRILGTMKFRRGSRELVSDATGQEQIGVLTTDELAVKYLSQAAQAGHGLAMQSFADFYENGRGVRESHLMCVEWLWRASLQQSTGALASLDSKTIIARELEGFSGMIEQMQCRVGPGQSFSLCGPNVGSLILVLYGELAADNYTLSSFANTTPTVCVGGTPRQGTTGPIPIIGANELKKLVSQITNTEQRGIDVITVYGRRGIAKAATAQTYGEATRSLDSNLFVVPPTPACDETPTDSDVSKWVSAASRYNHFGFPEGMEVHCFHSEGGRPRTVCRECIVDARERLSAVAKGSVVLSLQEVLRSRGHTAIWRSAGGTLKAETFKSYGRGEVECALAALVASKKYHGAKLASPLFVAQDPNFFWPLIFSHGCIRAALEYVAPHVDWNERLGCVNPSLEQFPIITSSDTQIKPRSILRKCGSDCCLKLEPDLKLGAFSQCGRCQRRCYCSQACAKDDWIIHKRECKAAAVGSTPTAEPAAPKAKKKPAETKRKDTGPTNGEEVVVHSLVARPEFNGCVGVISGDVVDGRYPVKLPSHDTKIAIKPTNFHRLGVFVVERANKARKFECSEHASKICSKCNLDFGIVNHLSELRSSGGPLTRQTIEYAADAHFATVRRDERGEVVFEFDRDFPMECQGLQNTDKRFVLKALLESKTKSLLVAAATAGMASFSARAEHPIRPNVIPHLETFLSAYNTGEKRANAER